MPPTGRSRVSCRLSSDLREGFMKKKNGKNECEMKVKESGCVR